MPCFVACLLLYLAGIITAEDNVDEAQTCEFLKFKLHVTDERKLEKRSPGKDEKERQDITEQDVENAFEQCQQILKDREELVAKLVEEGKIVTVRKADLSINRNEQAVPTVHNHENLQLPFDEATNHLAERFKLNSHTMNKRLSGIPLSGGLGSAARLECQKDILSDDCNFKSRYRTANGQCNHPNNNFRGSAMTCQPRLLSAYYNGNSQFRRSIMGELLPNPRTLSLNLHSHYNRPTNYVTHMYMFFGQLLDHDLTLTPISTTLDNNAIECCPVEGENHPQCAPIQIGNDDPFYSQFNMTCMNFVRSAICPTCNLGTREQLNQVTSFIDASFLYGNSGNETDNLRLHDGTGRLRAENSSYGELLPSSSDPESDQCSFTETNDICFESGDPRINQHTVLASLHTIFMREHNRIATELAVINPEWDEEKLFQETRRILGAIMQVITYKEFLPLTLGQDRMNYFYLWMREHGRTKFDRRDNPAITIEFSTAAFRFGHTLVNSVVTTYPRNESDGLLLLRNEFFQPFTLRRGNVGSLLRGASNSAAQWFDRHLVPDVTNFLYRVRGNATGLDLAAININRGRDHGIPSYVDMVRWCSKGDIDIQDFNDLSKNRLMEFEQVDALRRNYRYVQDIDLWPGLVMEIPNDGAVVGPTTACIIGIQFHRLKYGDRFYVEHSDQTGSFTNKQLWQLKRVKLSHIICLNAGVPQMPRAAMVFSSRNNPVINCQSVHGIDLNQWKE